jgi:hypothetical protein
MTVAHASARLTNAELGKLIGLDHSSASRLRRGERGCSVAVHVRIEEHFGWPVIEQFKALRDGSFAANFERCLSDYTATRPANRDTPAAS